MSERKGLFVVVALSGGLFDGAHVFTDEDEAIDMAESSADDDMFRDDEDLIVVARAGGETVWHSGEYLEKRDSEDEDEDEDETDLCQHCGATIPAGDFLCKVCQDIEDEDDEDEEEEEAQCAECGEIVDADDIMQRRGKWVCRQCADRIDEEDPSGV